MFVHCVNVLYLPTLCKSVIYPMNTAVEPKEPLPLEVNRLVPLTGQKLMAFVPEMAADYEVIGILLGQENSVRNIRAGAEGAHQKMIRILEEWTGTEDASWSALIEALENYTPRLCGVAAGIRLFLRKELENGEQIPLSNLFTYDTKLSFY